MTSDTPERYERLTSVSSSVDIDQRDTVSVLYKVAPYASVCVCGVVFFSIIVDQKKFLWTIGGVKEATITL